MEEEIKKIIKKSDLLSKIAEETYDDTLQGKTPRFSWHRVLHLIIELNNHIKSLEK